MQHNAKMFPSNLFAYAAKKPAIPIQESDSGKVRNRKAESQAFVFIDFSRANILTESTDLSNDKSLFIKRNVIAPFLAHHHLTNGRSG